MYTALFPPTRREEIHYASFAHWKSKGSTLAPSLPALCTNLRNDGGPIHSSAENPSAVVARCGTNGSELGATAPEASCIEGGDLSTG
jgi:hypothetical protein